VSEKVDGRKIPTVCQQFKQTDHGFSAVGIILYHRDTLRGGGGGGGKEEEEGFFIQATARKQLIIP
jgi:hypothetical protein